MSARRNGSVAEHLEGRSPEPTFSPRLKRPQAPEPTLNGGEEERGRTPIGRADGAELDVMASRAGWLFEVAVAARVGEVMIVKKGRVQGEWRRCDLRHAKCHAAIPEKEAVVGVRRPMRGRQEGRWLPPNPQCLFVRQPLAQADSLMVRCLA